MILPIALSLIAVASAYPAQTTVTVQEGNVCFDFIGEFGIDSLATLYANNPSINKDCTNLQIGQILDVSQTSGNCYFELFNSFVY